MDTRYEVRLVVCKDCDTMLDMNIGCENAQQLDKARRVIEERLLDYIAMFAMEQSLSGTAAPATLPKPESSTPTTPPRRKAPSKKRRTPAWLRKLLNAPAPEGC